MTAPIKSRRSARISQAILEAVSASILFGVKDPRIRNVTVIRVEVSPDVRSAKVYVSIRGDEKEQSLCMHGLNSARGFLQSKVADRLQTRYTPVLKFVLDSGVKRSVEAARILLDVLDESIKAEHDSPRPGAEDEGNRENGPASKDSAPAGENAPSQPVANQATSKDPAE